MSTFFFSYCRKDAADDANVLEFARDLREMVRGELSLPQSARVAFLDEDSIRVGESWSDSLASALASHQVLVALYSQDYFKRDFCGREVQVFLDRR